MNESCNKCYPNGTEIVQKCQKKKLYARKQSINHMTAIVSNVKKVAVLLYKTFSTR